jgi:hypothetical protein
MTEKLRDKVAVRMCSWILNHVATEHCRLMVTGALKLGLVTVAENELSGQDVHDLMESLGQMGEAVKLSETGPEDEKTWRERTDREIKEALEQLRGLDEAGRLCWLLGISREKLDELGGI